MTSSPQHTFTRRTTGFTIVELLIVIVVIGILAAITIVAYNGIQQRAKTAAITSAADQWEKIIRAEAITTGAMPSVGCLGSSSTDFPAKGDFLAGECVIVKQSGVKVSAVAYQSPWLGVGSSTTLPHGLLPHTSFKFTTSDTIEARGLWIYSDGISGGGVILAWVPQTAGVCGRGVSVTEGPGSFIDGGYCALTISR